MKGNNKTFSFLVSYRTKTQRTVKVIRYQNVTAITNYIYDPLAVYS